jgi:cytochrome c55X
MKLLLPLLLSSMTVAVAAATGITPARQAELHNLVVQDCGSCHGLTMRGGLGKPLLPEALKPFPDEAIAEVILDGVAGTPMPPWRGLITEDEALWIAKTLKRGVGP